MESVALNKPILTITISAGGPPMPPRHVLAPIPHGKDLGRGVHEGMTHEFGGESPEMRGDTALTSDKSLDTPATTAPRRRMIKGPRTMAPKRPSFGRSMKGSA